jgi:hypothetical protein
MRRLFNPFLLATILDRRREHFRHEGTRVVQEVPEEYREMGQK